MTKTLEDYKNGQILLIDKPLEWTSFQVVNKLRWHIKQQFNIKKIKVGHAGTLDPLATGLLIICTGKQTKNIHEYQGQIKEYTGTFTIGATTPSYDLETEVNETFTTEHITEDLLHKTTKQFLGKIQQKPPIFSAIKKDGKRLYELARKGETTEIKAREVEINEFEITNINLPKVDFRIVCSKGTYIRSIAYDYGIALNSGAHLSTLRRTKIGDFSTENAQSIEGFIEQLNDA
ncbi:MULTISPECIES: tRNA pseudouridine(55) synthase TruB [Tenacibaculum]|uniref:tRNA pseudouridine(55) synthase TruB n=1 Tax=Tenacibaculum TaxID=104267 RepID=UPI001F0ACE2C|nr:MULTISPECIES: tRNA pseudouridine(55) synthase TruB [Tenacibaculum]MCH3881651.1 tRNA pseudouridine(55) synthase TruB [Tenacibaculum aquimarinum]MDO6598764.1 tRNA pseudouridine(55) synthase TruB [Tenacibaculum sp. 1_MG-2023]